VQVSNDCVRGLRLVRFIATSLASSVLAAYFRKPFHIRLNCFPRLKSGAEAIFEDHSHLRRLAGAMDEQLMVTHIDQSATRVVARPKKCKPYREPETQRHTFHRLMLHQRSADSSRFRIEPIKKIARSLGHHRELILAYFRTDQALELALYHSLGKLSKPGSTHDFF